MKYLFIASILLILFQNPSIGQNQKSAEFTIGFGVTGIDVESLVEEDEVQGTVASDWGTTNVGISGQFFFTSFGSITFGTELMYQYLYWYSVEVPYGTQTIYREYSVSAVKITPIFRLGATEKFKFDFGPQINFMDGVAIGLLVSGNYYVPINENLSVPIKLRIDVINGIEVTVPVSLNAGLSIKL